MPGLTLLNIDRESTSTGDPQHEITDIIQEIEHFISGLDRDTQAARLVPLKMKLRRLQDSVAQFGSDGSIPVEKKQAQIMELHPDLQMLANRLQMFGGKYAVHTEICMNFLLNHLCSSAAADPRGTVIGVSNVMAQVLSNDINIIPPPDFALDPSNPKYFEEFSRIFNSMLTTAGLFASPVLGLPDIPISALGAWADQALAQFGNINQFVREQYDPKTFYIIDQNEKAIPFDTTTDILSFYIFENEFLAALIARADILSGLELPGSFAEDGNPIMLQSTDDITELLANSITHNCEEILDHMNTIDDMFNSGLIDRNEKPDEHPHLMNFKIEAKIWMDIAKLASTLVEIFNNDSTTYDLNEHKWGKLQNENLPAHNTDNPSVFQKKLLHILDDLYSNLQRMFPQAEKETHRFIQSSEFTKFRDYLSYVIHIVAAHDLLLDTKYTWVSWLLENLKSFISGTASQYNPINSLEVGVLALILGIEKDLSVFIEQGIIMLNEVKSNLEFQSHHLLAIEILTKLSKIYQSSPEKVANIIQDLVQNFLNNNQISTNSMLFQRANLFLAMLEMYKTSGEYLRKENERFVAFDPFSWINTSGKSENEFPYMPLNTSLDNLNSN